MSGNHHGLYARRGLHNEPFEHIAQVNNRWNGGRRLLRRKQEQPGEKALPHMHHLRSIDSGYIDNLYK